MNTRNITMITFMICNFLILDIFLMSTHKDDYINLNDIRFPLVETVSKKYVQN